jgi:plastocyanin
MYKKIFAGIFVFTLLTVILVACGIRDVGNSTNPAVHMGGANFNQPSVTIHKGESLDLVDDSTAQHIIKNGTWQGTSPEVKTESGAPTVNVTLNGMDTATIGPFNTSGSFQLLCTIHPGMNLTVNVQ